MGTRTLKILSPIVGAVLLLSLAASSSASLAATGSVSQASTQSSEPAATAKPAKPARQIALGVSMLSYDNLSALDSFTDSVGGQAPAIWSVWSDWGGTNAAFPTALMNGLRDRGVTPMVFWQPVHTGDLTDSTYTYRNIANGDFDDYITAWAQAAKHWGGAVIVRFAHEMDGTWFPWSLWRPGDTAAQFKQAWRHIWNIFRGPHGVGANNVRFLWSPYSPQASYRSFYPGDQYVDYVGFTGLNWGNYATHQWQSMQDIFAGPTAQLRKITHKPIIVAEAGSNVVGGDKSAWIRNGYPAVYNSHTASAIVAIVYFNVDVAGQVNWLLTTPAGNPPPALAAYAAIAADHRFQGRMTHPAAPTAEPPAVQFAANAQVHGPAKVLVSWQDATSTAGIVRYKLQQQTGQGRHKSWKNVRLPSARTTSVAVSAKPGRRLTFRVKALDANGHWSSWAVGHPARVTVSQDSSHKIHYSGTFKKAPESKALDGHVHFSVTAGSAASFSFNGRSVALLTSRGPDHGVATVWLDGTQVATIDLYATSRQPAWIAFAAVVSAGHHTLQVRVTGDKNPKSSSTRVDIDAFMVLR